MGPPPRAITPRRAPASRAVGKVVVGAGGAALPVALNPAVTPLVSSDESTADFRPTALVADNPPVAELTWKREALSSATPVVVLDCVTLSGMRPGIGETPGVGAGADSGADAGVDGVNGREMESVLDAPLDQRKVPLKVGPWDPVPMSRLAVQGPPTPVGTAEPEVEKVET